ncbi:MAG TPA: ADP-ribosylation factor-like protein, partial [Candidatus Obscuribacterales bacterium]
MSCPTLVPVRISYYDSNNPGAQVPSDETSTQAVAEDVEASAAQASALGPELPQATSADTPAEKDILAEALEALDREPGLILQLWDVGGQEVYRTLHELFFSPVALYIVVCDVSEPGFADVLRKWRSMLCNSEQTQSAQIMCLLTHADEIDPARLDPAIREAEAVWRTEKGRSVPVYVIFTPGWTPSEAVQAVAAPRALLRQHITATLLSLPALQCRYPNSYLLLYRFLDILASRRRPDATAIDVVGVEELHRELDKYGDEVLVPEEREAALAQL